MPASEKRLIAFFLPQFHPIPENDAWWGKGFTEWTNVAKARPLFEGHYQPHLPSDLGFYDLRLPETRRAQAVMAREHGIAGFCYYHYWFNGRRVLERPITEIVSSGEPDFPFCLCWANENWTRRWDGQEEDVLLEQVYSREDDLRHIRALIPLFQDPRYIRVDGRPFLLIYRIGHLPDARQTIELWREEALRAGLPGLYLANVESFWNESVAGDLPLDAAVEFAPDWQCLGPKLKYRGRRASLFQKEPISWSANNISSYVELRDRMLQKPKTTYLRYPCVTPMWDNTARRRDGATVLVDSSPQAYEEWLAQVMSEFCPPTPEENFVFINAWNEWAEGNHLEPCQRWGDQYLQATKRAALKADGLSVRSD